MNNLTNIQQQAIKLYTPPFIYKDGYVFDANGYIVLDNVIEVTKDIDFLRIRGWGRISYMENSEELQDTVGKLVAIALTEFWDKHNNL